VCFAVTVRIIVENPQLSARHPLRQARENAFAEHEFKSATPARFVPEEALSPLGQKSSWSSRVTVRVSTEWQRTIHLVESVTLSRMIHLHAERLILNGMAVAPLAVVAWDAGRACYRPVSKALRLGLSAGRLHPPSTPTTRRPRRTSIFQPEFCSPRSTTPPDPMR